MPGAVALRRSARRTARSSATRRASSACRSPPTCARHARRGVRERSAVALRSAVDAGAARAVEVRAGALRRARQGRFQRDRLQLLRRLGRGARRARDASCRGRAGARSTSSSSELMIFVNSTWGKRARRRARRGTLPHAGERQGEDEHATRRASGAGALALPVGELAAAPLQRPRQPAAAARRARRREAARTRENDAELFAALADFEATYSALRRVPGPDGALLVPALAAAGKRRPRRRRR